MMSMAMNLSSGIGWVAVFAISAAACRPDGGPGGGLDAGIATEGGINLDSSGAGPMASTAVTDGTMGEKLDVGGGMATGGGGDCLGGGGSGELEFSNIWIANTPEGTVSKIDTKTGMELGRYRTGAGSDSDPSRTSVNLLGDVAVVNRAGGSVVKIAARLERCVDTNGDGVIQTSTGPNDVLDWQADECVLWETPLYTGARAAAWDSGSDPDAQGCLQGAPQLWVSAMDETNTVHVYRLNGETGQILDQADLPNWTGSWGGIYGGAVNAERDFYGVGKENTVLVHVDAETMELTVYDAPGVQRFYGIAMDGDGYPWIASEFDDILFRFNVETEEFESQGPTGHGSLRGLAVDSQGNAWIAANNPCDLVHYDTQAGVYTNIALEGCGTPVGVSIDAEGFIWVVDQGSSRAYKVDPNNNTVVTTVMGLVSPYTYSDMTGAGLNLVTNPPTG